ncbi:WD40 repeat-like protein [Exidia glandulosa HHB12029]|uniref:WD40 repeat-like protein n=1 Tax=Exidia glandulosa HHB12029 TaxID=1314781 RepID=A0A165HLM1_EXIGL|nr:WD40 repeat-like protein [Exidia glandulosa HHB12029]
MLIGTAGEPLHGPAPFTALAMSGELIAAGSEDGSVRLYRVSETRVHKAIRAFGDEVSSLAFVPASDVIWIASGQHIYAFDINTETLVLKREDATVQKRVLNDDENVLNEIALNKTHLAFTCDDGRIGTYELSTQEVKFLKPQHKSVSSPLAFIPNRPRELVSGGYDCTLLHTDFLLGSFLSSLDLSGGTSPADTGAVPPFIHSLDVSPDGRIACGLADGRVWIGSGGVKGLGKKKKWDGLDEQQGAFHTVATGPVVGLAFRDESSVFMSSLNGVLKLVAVTQSQTEGTTVTIPWSAQTTKVAKVNALAYDAATHRLVIAGITLDGKGALETWTFENTQ